MYAESGLMFPNFHNFALEVQQFDEFWTSQKPNASLGIPSSLVQTSTISDYNLGGEGDLFNAPELVIREQLTGLDPMTITDIESSIESGQLFSEAFYACRNDILAQEGTNETPLSEVLSIENPTVKMDENFIADEKLLPEGSFQRSVRSSSLRLMDCVIEAPPRPDFLDFPVMDFEEVYGMRRAFSEGDIKNLGNGHISFVQSPTEKPRIMSSCISEERREKLSRYWSKKSKRNFGRKIKYACRKVLADSQPRIRGRFAKTE
ncbi:hypothetical protein BUALT_Bualt01G0080700 [Buddleja alternifolia]|uniref:CCT domain-containing protein n=1 Tax=Buddleja alternifolia TaxID=168488 RepID=A0AAV6YFV9_9LAMI|nr:hypothetical protein BUALT_Bualt01G0080700 [Buddleja alternifolia]